MMVQQKHWRISYSFSHSIFLALHHASFIRARMTTVRLYVENSELPSQNSIATLFYYTMHFARNDTDTVAANR